MYFVYRIAPYGMFLHLLQEIKWEIKHLFLIPPPPQEQKNLLVSLIPSRLLLPPFHVPPADVCCDCQGCMCSHVYIYPDCKWTFWFQSPIMDFHTDFI